QAPDQTNVTPELAKAVLYANITIGDTVLMASDVPPDRFQPMRSVYLCLGVDSDAEAERIYRLLSDGGEVFMPIQETFFASRFAQLRDRFGTSWMIIHERPQGPQQ
ncbi:MAG TPA: VOC family protein, partial [Terracidiphilus sp.]|nr:VOC family protein [Terracidiphilus sp.]